MVTNLAQARNCLVAVRKLLRDRIIGEADVVILSARWKEWAAERLPAVIALLKTQTSVPILVVGPQAEFQPIVPQLIEMHGTLQGIDDAARNYEDLRRRKLNDWLRTETEMAGAIYVDKFALLCGDGACPILIPGSGKLFIWDYGHWSVEGARYFGEQLKADPALGQAIFVGG